MRLILVRHGQTMSNLQGTLDTGVPGADLTDLGRQQAGAAAPRLALDGIGAIFASSLVRTQQTAAPLAELLGLEVVVRDGLREARAGDLEMRSDAASVRTYLKTYLAWINGDLDARMPGGDAGTDVVARVDAVMAEASEADADVVAVFSHGATIRAWCAARAHNLSAAYIAHHPLHNCGAVYLVRGPGQSWTVERWQDEAVGGLDLVARGDPSAETPDDLTPGRTSPS
jgi:broad specificity phosphatase PhoE